MGCLKLHERQIIVNMVQFLKSLQKVWVTFISKDYKFLQKTTYFQVLVRT